ncbi:CaiB/BaiF CoA-transferase family protein [Maritimibacter sp. UBA3975]|uniref:CaiB/BaiF CoA transferase family protein n=1 Tax=Maritimibacter sp. UBA3975 TaxID=1946833 RepID=UPI000C09F125|nr:CaiB/BaiF CoA-transferase family protein [Maritimibacter sp. UBA3975]MAM60342.1 carnitine dehydratase [Maritimibacter sp.]|tara:strand:+ start:539 stop:1666 length:1128 start_codon:yes stop_codon:yes gene_type:complete
MSGPLEGLKVVEMQGLGPAPLAGQFLADLGAEVVLVTRKSGPADKTDINNRGKRSVALNLKSPKGVSAAMALIESADVLIEGFRPGVMERMELGPEDCHAVNPRLVYGRMTGWGQDGPLAQTAGHDINYLGLTGFLHATGEADRTPPPPLNIGADYGGGTMFLLFGIMAALYERQTSGKGQVVDAAMVDGASAMMGLIHTFIARGQWTEDRQANLLDGGAPFYRTYECADGKFLAVGPLEPQFYAELVRLAGLTEDHLASQNAMGDWPDRRAAYAEVFRQKTRDEWAAIFDGSDACASPVLTWSEAPDHPHMAARGTFTKVDGVTQAAPAPRFSRSAPSAPTPPQAPGSDTDTVLKSLGYDDDAIAQLRDAGVLT